MDVVSDFKADQSAGEEQNKRFQTAIDTLAACDGGGTLTVPGGAYYLRGIELRSDVHLLIHEDAVIYPAKRSLGKGNSVFRLGKNTRKHLKNVSITGLGAGFMFDFTKGGKRAVAIDVGNVSNFKLANFSIQDKQTVFASILFNISVSRGDVMWARKGLIEKIHQTNAHVGYGLIQAYAADTILFDEISSDGGVALRLETDNLRMKELGKGGVNDIYGTNIGCKNGMAAVMLSPHFMKNGTVSIDGIRAESCAFAVRTEPGFVEIFGEKGQTRGAVTKQVEDRLGKGSVSVTYARANGTRFAARIKPAFSDAAFAEYKLKPGSFSKVSLKNITSKHGQNSQFKTPQRPFLTCEEQTRLCKPMPNRNVVRGGSITAIYDMARTDRPGGYQISTETVEALNFPVQNRTLVTPQSKRHKCPATNPLPVCR